MLEKMDVFFEKRLAGGWRGQRERNPQEKTAFGGLFLVVTQRGFEPRTFALKGRCSTN